MKLKKKTKTLLQQLVLTPKKVQQQTFKKRLPGRKLDLDKYDIFDRKKFFPQEEEEFSVVGIDHNEQLISESNAVLQVGNVEEKGLTENEPTLSCQVCKKTFTVKRKYNGHVKRAHVKNIKTEEVAQPSLSSRPTRSSSPEEQGNTPEPEARSSTPEIPQLVTPEVSSLISSTPELSPTPEIPLAHVESSTLEPTNDQIPDENDKNNYCKVCQKTFSKRKIYRQHVKKVHHVNLTPLKKLIHDPNNPPDIDDSNHYCTPCGKSYYNRFIYRKHLRQVHKLSLLKVPKAVPDHFVQPNPDDPDFFCQSCQISYDSQQKYRQHISYVHYIKTEPPKQYPVYDPDLVVNVYDPENTSCHICKKDYQKKSYYKKHMKKAHGDGNKQPVAGVPTRTDIEPDLNDPNHHCRSCSKTLSSRWTYLRHLKLVHPMVNLTTASSKKKTKAKNHTASSSSGKKNE